MKPDRRRVVKGLIAVGAAAVSGCAVSAAQTAAALPGPDIWLWPDGPPGHAPRSVKPGDQYHVANPGLFVFRPEKANGAAILLFQGGGYVRVGRGPGVPTYFAQHGYTVFDMRYRLPHAGWEAGPDVTLQDAQRGMRIIRSRAAEFGVKTDRVGVMGYSAGGHMASYISTAYAREMAPSGSGLTEFSPRPDFACLGCPVVTMTDPYAHNGSRESLFGDARDPRELALRSTEQLVTRDTPPMFIVHAADDKVVSPNNSIMLFTALRAADVPAEMHIFEKGGHNMGPAFQPGSPLSAFPQLMLDWLARRGFAG